MAIFTGTNGNDTAIRIHGTTDPGSIGRAVSNGCIRMRNEAVMALFDHVIESAKIGLRKPDPRIYRMMLETLQVNPGNCVYLDDLGVNLKPAREMGMTTIKVAKDRKSVV